MIAQLGELAAVGPQLDFRGLLAIVGMVLLWPLTVLFAWFGYATAPEVSKAAAKRQAIQAVIFITVVDVIFFAFVGLFLLL